MVAKSRLRNGHDCDPTENGHSSGSATLVITNLTDTEYQKLVHCEEVIAKHLATFFDVGNALLEIQASRLYRAEFGTFEEYCRKRWGFSRVHAHRLLTAAEIRQKLLLPMGNNSLADNERQLRPLSGLSPELAQKAWKRAVEKAGGSKPTGRMVEEAVVELRKKALTKVLSLQETWQRLVAPLLSLAMKKTKSGDRDAVEDALNKAKLFLEIGRSHERVDI